MQIRKAKKEDLGKIWEFEKKNREMHKKLIEEKYCRLFETSRKAYKKNLNKKEYIDLVAEEDKHIIGYIFGYVFLWRLADRPFKIAYIDKLYVAREHRGRGAASRLVKEFSRTAKRKGAAFIALDVCKANIGAVKFYEKLNFRNMVDYLVKRI